MYDFLKGLCHGVDNFINEKSFMDEIGMELGLKNKTFIVQVKDVQILFVYKVYLNSTNLNLIGIWKCRLSFSKISCETWGHLYRSLRVELCNCQS
jgi:hypothetical protein